MAEICIFLYYLRLSHNTSVTDGRTTNMPIARLLLKYGRLKIETNTYQKPKIEKIFSCIHTLDIATKYRENLIEPNKNELSQFWVNGLQ